MINLQLAINLKVPHGWALCEKFHMIEHHLIFIDQRKNVFEMNLILELI